MIDSISYAKRIRIVTCSLAVLTIAKRIATRSLSVLTLRGIIPLISLYLVLSVLSPSSALGWVWNDIQITKDAINQIHPRMANSGQGHFMMVWENRENETSDIYGIIQTIGQATPLPMQICAVPGDQRNPVIAWDGTNYLIVWEDTRSGSSCDIYATRVTPGGSVLDSDTSQRKGRPLCSAVYDQFHPSLVWNGQNYMVVWEDYRNSSGKIYALRVSKSLQLLDGSAGAEGFLVGGGPGNQTRPEIAWNGTNHLVVWEGHANESSSHIYGCRISASGQVLDTAGGGFPVMEDETMKLNPAVASDGEGFLVVWDAHSTSYADIFGLLVSSEGLPDPQGPFPVSTADMDQLSPFVVWCKNHYLVLWKDTRNGKADLYLACLNNAGTFLGVQTESTGINLGIVGSSILGSQGTAVFNQDTAEYFIVWEENRSNNFDIYSQRYQAVAPPVLSWTGQADYQNDGVNPNNGTGGTLFEFRVKYQNPTGLAPNKLQVWIDQDDDGLYFLDPQASIMDKIINMTKESGTDYKVGVIYKASTVIEYAGDGKINYRFVFSDSSSEATGVPTRDHQILLGNSPATLEWVNTTGYLTDGVNPDSAPGGSTFTFMVRYLDAENDPPSCAEVWIDLNLNDVYDADEKLALTASDDQSFSEGRAYLRSVQCLYLPQALNTGTVSLNYRFFFLTGDEEAGGEPSNDHSFSVTPYLSVPFLSWPQDSGFSQGVRLKDEVPGGTYEFCVTYQDGDNDHPVTKEVWIDKNNDGYFDYEEKYTMEEVSSSDQSVIDGKMYRLVTSFANAEEEEIFYQFVFSDGRNLATGEPFLAGAQVTVSPYIHSPVYLSWTGEEGYTADGVDPDSSPAASWFHFRVKYSNENNFPPQKRQLWLDENNNGQYEDLEKHTMEDHNPNDLNYIDGKIYALDLAINPPSTPVSLSYTFVFRDIYFEAAGEPANSSIEVTILDKDSSPDPNSPDGPDDPYTPQRLQSSQGGCFIRSLSLFHRFSIF